MSVRKGGVTTFTLVAAYVALIAVPAAAQAPPQQQPAAEPSAGAPGPEAPIKNANAAAAVRDSRIKLRIGGLRGGRLTVGKSFTAKGTLAPFVKGERVKVIVRRGGKTILTKVVTPKRKPGANFSRFRISKRQVTAGRYSVQAIHKRNQKLGYSEDRSRTFRIRYPGLNEGNRSNTVQLFNRLLARLGYVNDEGKRFDAATARAVLAYRKANEMSRNSKATGKIFKKLTKGRGGYKLRYPDSGKHVEIDISRQVMVLAKGGKVKEIYGVSTGAAATPTPPGTWRFYRKDPGYNSLGMYYSVYWNRGYATEAARACVEYGFKKLKLKRIVGRAMAANAASVKVLEKCF